MNARVAVVAAVAVAASAVLLGSAGARTSGSAMSVVLSPLIGTTVNDVQQVTFGDRIGYHLEVKNTGQATVNHILIVVESDSATFLDASRPECAADPGDAKRMVCVLDQLKKGAGFAVDLRFTAPTTGSSVVSTPSVTVNAQTQGNPGNHGSQKFTGTPVTTALVSSAGGSVVQSFVRGAESVATGASLPQHSLFTLPGSIGALFGVATSVQETTGTPLCATCPTLVTILQIPVSLTGSSPFTPTNPFSFTVTLTGSARPAGYHPTGLYHDGVLVPMCSVSPLGPHTHICLTSFDPGHTPTADIVAVGIADQNGRIGFG
ncbi:MAG TPA: hypothetical protein VFA66_04165 [Gaiellaceae bacterium]|nr:hypothetical protein [Gaiellaceae bacterium]